MQSQQQQPQLSQDTDSLDTPLCITRGLLNPDPASYTLSHHSTDTVDWYPCISLVRDDNNKEDAGDEVVQEAYAFRKDSFFSINHHHSLVVEDQRDGRRVRLGWGRIYTKCIKCHRSDRKDKQGRIVFQAAAAATPREGEAEYYFAIKVINKSVLADYLKKGGQENPYIEIARMQRLDNQYIMPCIDAFDTNPENPSEGFLMIVMPQAKETLTDVIFGENHGVIVGHDRIHHLFRELLEILDYLAKQNLCHRDIKPDNLFLLGPDNRLVVSDMALSRRIPLNVNGYHLPFEGPNIFAGTPRYMAPEMYRTALNDGYNHFNADTMSWERIRYYPKRQRAAESFQGTDVDLWAATVCLFYALISDKERILYEIPLEVDEWYIFHLRAKGLSTEPNYERLERVLSGDRFLFLQSKIDAIFDENRAIGTRDLTILENVFKEDPNDPLNPRWELDEVRSFMIRQDIF